MRHTRPLAFETLTVSNAPVGFTSATISPVSGRAASRAVVAVEAQPIRYRDDGGAPTATVGIPVLAGVTFEVEGVDAVRSIRFIRSGAVDATLSVAYYR